jgi:Family of unknown function (DUF5946)
MKHHAERCVGCGATVDTIDGPVHRYMTSAPACWQRYGAVLSGLYVRPELQTSLVMCVDTYAVQHPGTPNPQAIQSVAVHLLNLHGYLVRKRPVDIPQRTVSEKAFHAVATPAERAAYWLEPPSFAGALTVFDMPIDGTDAAVSVAARAWAESVWAAWSAHHERVAEWYTRFATPS